MLQTNSDHQKKKNFQKGIQGWRNNEVTWKVILVEENKSGRVDYYNSRKLGRLCKSIKSREEKIGKRNGSRITDRNMRGTENRQSWLTEENGFKSMVKIDNEISGYGRGPDSRGKCSSTTYFHRSVPLPFDLVPDL